MARYIDADVLIEKMTLGEYIFAETPFQKGVNANTEFWISEIKYMPTADVVPKSEVERLVDKWIGEEKLTQDEKTLRLIEALMDEAKRYEKYYFNHEYDKMIAEAKQEVASEIFEEIEELDIQLNNGDLGIKYFGSAIAKLKKKHTESEGKE